MSFTADVNARLAAVAGDRRSALIAVLIFALAHALVWAAILSVLKSAQDVHLDIGEVYQWGRQFLFGYGKHPPLSAWIAGLWFRIFPVVDWAAYLLATTVLAAALVINWLIVIRVTDARRALLAVLLLSLYPIFNIKGFKYNADLLQLVTLSLTVLAFLHAFTRRTILAGILLGLAGAAAVMTKYWAVLVIGAVGLSALLHAQRWVFLRSPAPWAAIVAFLLTLLPHLWWLRSVDFLPFTYADGVYHTIPAQAWKTWRMYIAHNIAMLVPVVLVLVVAIRPWQLRWPPAQLRVAADRAQAVHVWIILAALAFVPVIMGPLLSIYMKTDWGIPLFFLFPLALLILPGMQVRRDAAPRALAVWMVFSLGMLILSPVVARIEFRGKPESQSVYGARSELAQELTALWRKRFTTPFAYIAATTEIGAAVGFYSPDHPVTFSPGEVWASGLVDVTAMRKAGFIGVCANDDPVRAMCETWMAQHAPTAERHDIALQRHWRGLAGPRASWQVYVVAPGEAR